MVMLQYLLVREILTTEINSTYLISSLLKKTETKEVTHAIEIPIVYPYNIISDDYKLLPEEQRNIINNSSGISICLLDAKRELYKLLIDFLKRKGKIIEICDEDITGDDDSITAYLTSSRGFVNTISKLSTVRHSYSIRDILDKGLLGTIGDRNIPIYTDAFEHPLSKITKDTSYKILKHPGNYALVDINISDGYDFAKEEGLLLIKLALI